MPKTSQPDLARYLRSKGSPLADHVPDLYRVANKYRIDPRLIVAVSGGETSFGKEGSGPSVYNAWGIGPGRSYNSWADGLDAAASLLRTGYVGKGLTSLTKIQQKWAPHSAPNDPTGLNSNWTRNVGSIYSDLGGNPDDVVSGWRNSASPKVTSVSASPSPKQQESQLDYDPVGDVAFRNLLDIAKGGSATKALHKLVQASVDRTLAEAAAKRTQQPPAESTSQRSPDGGFYSATPTRESAKLPEKQNAVRLAKQQIGRPYVWGGTSPKSGFDCSGLIEWAFEQAGIPTPGRLTTHSMMKVGRSVRGAAEPGDWIITNRGQHVVMYIGGGEVIAAPRRGTNVQVQKLSDHRDGIVDIRRFP